MVPAPFFILSRRSDPQTRAASAGRRAHFAGAVTAFVVTCR